MPWTHNLLVLGKSKREEEREFYLTLAISQRWCSRELERQINSALIEYGCRRLRHLGRHLLGCRREVELSRDVDHLKFLHRWYDDLIYKIRRTIC